MQTLTPTWELSADSGCCVSAFAKRQILNWRYLWQKRRKFFVFPVFSWQPGWTNRLLLTAVPLLPLSYSPPPHPPPPPPVFYLASLSSSLKRPAVPSGNRSWRHTCTVLADAVQWSPLSAFLIWQIWNRPSQTYAVSSLSLMICWNGEKSNPPVRVWIVLQTVYRDNVMK